MLQFERLASARPAISARRRGPAPRASQRRRNRRPPTAPHSAFRRESMPPPRAATIGPAIRAAATPAARNPLGEKLAGARSRPDASGSVPPALLPPLSRMPPVRSMRLADPKPRRTRRPIPRRCSPGTTATAATCRGARPPGSRADPYRVWLSEIMLQQTTVATVGPYFDRFVARWPDIRALAAASLDEVLHQWQGLGYYARARNLHACARAVVARHGGEFPRDLAALRALPGVGDYTAAAIAAIAFDQPYAAVDGNVERVMARVFAERDAAAGGEAAAAGASPPRSCRGSGPAISPRR